MDNISVIGDNLPQMTRSLPTKNQIMKEITDLLGHPQIETTVGSSIPSVFFSDIASAMGIPITSGMPSMAKRIIENAGLTWMSEFSSENAPSGGGGTVTTLGLLQIRNAVLIWLGHDSLGIPDQYLDWEPDPRWLEKRNKLPRNLTETIKRPGADEFRKYVLSVYNNTCAVSKFTTTQAIEIAHIVPYYGTESDHIENVIPLRTDLHKLFDKGLLNIAFSEKDKTYEIEIHDTIKNDYGNFHETTLSLPGDKNFAPSRFALSEHQELFKHLWQTI